MTSLIERACELAVAPSTKSAARTLCSKAIIPNFFLCSAFFIVIGWLAGILDNGEFLYVPHLECTYNVFAFVVC